MGSTKYSSAKPNEENCVTKDREEEDFKV